MVRQEKEALIGCFMSLWELAEYAILSLSSVTDYLSEKKGKGGDKMSNIAIELVLSVVAEIIAGLILHRLCKWLDSEENERY